MRCTSLITAALGGLLLSATGSIAQVGGPYLATCERVQQRGPILSADCRTRRGDYRQSRIDVSECRGGVSNDNGRLVCDVGRGGGRGGVREEYGDDRRSRREYRDELRDYDRRGPSRY